MKLVVFKEAHAYLLSRHTCHDECSQCLKET